MPSYHKSVTVPDCFSESRTWGQGSWRRNRAQDHGDGRNAEVQPTVSSQQLGHAHGLT